MPKKSSTKPIALNAITLDEKGRLPEPHQEALSVGHVLQTTLDIHQLMKLFYNEVTRRLPISGLTFDSLERGIALSQGKVTEPVLECGLRIDRTLLGDLVLFSTQPLTHEQLMLVEACLSALLFPLRNALQYHQALLNSTTDAVTGIGNRSAFEPALAAELEFARTKSVPLSIVFIDIDNFKHINDTYGHAAGDIALQTLAKTLLQICRNSDRVFRFGGDEFVILLKRTPVETAQRVIKRIMDFLAKSPCEDGEHTFNISISAGVTALIENDSPMCFFKRADDALYQAKHNGKKQILVK